MSDLAEPLSPSSRLSPSSPSSRSQPPSPPVIIVGVDTDQPVRVLETAADLAVDTGARLLCLRVDTSGVAVGGGVTPLDPDSDGDTNSSDPLPDRLASVLDPRGVGWTYRVLAGGAAQQLDRAAREVDARFIVVGTREHGAGAMLREVVTGSVAAELAHHQSRPLVVVPLGVRSERH